MNIEGPVCEYIPKKKKPKRQKSVSIDQNDFTEPKDIPSRMRITSTVNLPKKSTGIPPRERSKSLFEPTKSRQPSDENELDNYFFEFMAKTFHPLENKPKELPKINDFKTSSTKINVPKSKREYILSIPTGYDYFGPQKYYYPNLKEINYMNVDECLYNNRIGKLVSNGTHSLFINTRNTIEITNKNIQFLKIPYGTIVKEPLSSSIQKYFI